MAYHSLVDRVDGPAIFVVQVPPPPTTAPPTPGPAPSHRLGASPRARKYMSAGFAAGRLGPELRPAAVSLGR